MHTMHTMSCESYEVGVICIERRYVCYARRASVHCYARQASVYCYARRASVYSKRLCRRASKRNVPRGLARRFSTRGFMGCGRRTVKMDVKIAVGCTADGEAGDGGYGRSVPLLAETRK